MPQDIRCYPTRNATLQRRDDRAKGDAVLVARLLGLQRLVTQKPANVLAVIPQYGGGLLAVHREGREVDVVITSVGCKGRPDRPHVIGNATDSVPVAGFQRFLEPGCQPSTHSSYLHGNTLNKCCVRRRVTQHLLHVNSHFRPRRALDSLNFLIFQRNSSNHYLDKINIQFNNAQVKLVVAERDAMSSAGPAIDDRPAIEVQELSKRYRAGALANDHINLSIARGTVFGLLGPNGAGKTTLVRQITGELAPTAGEIHIHGTDVLRHPLAAKALMGVVPQEASPYLHLRPDEHLLLFGRLHGLDKAAARRRAAELLTALGLSEHTRVPAERLSGGLKRKLLVGNALMAEPPVLILDEPTTGLDPHSRREVWALVRSQHGRGATVLVTTHYMEEAEALCDQVAIIGGGRILAMGTVGELRSLCRNRYKATFGGENGDQRETLYSSTYDDLVGELARRGVQEYSIGKTTLEDVYLELTARPLSENERHV
jgi:ABC-2 type transport system ATP-binding protein